MEDTIITLDMAKVIAKGLYQSEWSQLYAMEKEIFHKMKRLYLKQRGEGLFSRWLGEQIEDNINRLVCGSLEQKIRPMHCWDVTVPVKSKDYILTVNGIKRYEFSTLKSVCLYLNYDEYSYFVECLCTVRDKTNQLRAKERKAINRIVGRYLGDYPEYAKYLPQPSMKSKIIGFLRKFINV